VDKAKKQEWSLVIMVTLMSVAANLPERLPLPWGIDRRYLLGALAVLVIAALVRYLQYTYVLVVVILAIGANLPTDIANELGIRPDLMFVGLIAMVGVSFANYILKLPKGAKPIMRLSNENGARALCNAAMRGRNSLIYSLLSVGMDPNVPDSYGNVALVLAASFGHADTVKLLLDNGANVNLQDKLGRTALAAATEGGYSQTALVLKHAGAKA
jgi:hypothetical protein